MRYVFNSKQIVIRQIANNTIALNAESGEFFTIAGSGELIINFVNEPKTMKEILDKVSNSYECDSIETVELETKKFIINLLEKKLILEYQ